MAISDHLFRGRAECLQNFKRTMQIGGCIFKPEIVIDDTDSFGSYVIKGFIVVIACIIILSLLFS